MIKASIQLTTLPFNSLLENGESIDFRLDEDRWKPLKKGDIIEFWEDLSGWDKFPQPNARIVTVCIVDIFRAQSFSDLIQMSKNDGFFKDEDADNIVSDLRRWWTPEREKHTGVLGLKVKIA